MNNFHEAFKLVVGDLVRPVVNFTGDVVGYVVIWAATTAVVVSLYTWMS